MWGIVIGVNIIVNDLLVNYTRQGKGPVIVMLHGWGDRLQTFDALVSQLDNTYEVIRLDLAGFGGSQPPGEPWGLDEYADQVASFLKKTGLKPSVLLGHSNGGAVAIRGIASHRLEADKLILLASAGVRSPAKGRKVAWRAVAKAGKVTTMALPASVRSKIRSRLYTSLGSDLLVAPGMEATFKRVTSQDIQSDAHGITLPTLIVSGGRDTATPPDFAKKFHQLITNSKLVMLDDADHFLHQNHTDEVAEAVKEFLKR